MTEDGRGSRAVATHDHGTLIYRCTQECGNNRSGFLNSFIPYTCRFRLANLSNLKARKTSAYGQKQKQSTECKDIYSNIAYAFLTLQKNNVLFYYSCVTFRKNL